MIYVDGLKLLDESDKQPNWNLLTGTADFNGTEWLNLNKTNSKFNQLRIADYTSVPWNGVSEYYNAIIGTYTFSFFAHITNNASNYNLYFYAELNSKTEQSSSGITYNSATVNVTSPKWSLSNEWKRYSVTFNVTNSGAVRPRIETNSTDPKIELAGFKLERGSIATPWMPAISDLALKSDLGG